MQTSDTFRVDNHLLGTGLTSSLGVQATDEQNMTAEASIVVKVQVNAGRWKCTTDMAGVLAHWEGYAALGTTWANEMLCPRQLGLTR